MMLKKSIFYTVFIALKVEVDLFISNKSYSNSNSPSVAYRVFSVDGQSPESNIIQSVFMQEFS